MKKTLSILLTILMIFAILPVGAITVGAETATSGTTGQCTWTLNGTVLTISGNGRMQYYSYSYSSPWGKDITEIIIEDGVTSIGDFAFTDCASLKSITIPYSVKGIGGAAFDGCNNLTDVYYDGSEAEWNEISIEYYGCYYCWCHDPYELVKPDVLCDCCDYDYGPTNTALQNATKHFKTVENIEIITLPEKTVYYEITDDLDLTGGKIKVNYTDGTNKVVNLTAAVVTGFDNFVLGDQTLTVTYREKIAQFNVSVIPLHSFVNGICTDCGGKQIVFKNITVTPPPFPHFGEYVYSPLSVTDTKAEGFYFDLKRITVYDGTDTIFYFYDADYNDKGSYTVEYLKENTVKIDGNTLRVRLVSKSGSLKYNANLVSIRAIEAADLNRNYKVDANDIVVLKQTLLGVNNEDVNADVNGDEAVNVLDFVALNKTLVNPPVEEPVKIEVDNNLFNMTVA